MWGVCNTVGAEQRVLADAVELGLSSFCEDSPLRYISGTVAPLTWAVGF
jgi:hypothetical protein